MSAIITCVLFWLYAARSVRSKQIAYDFILVFVVQFLNQGTGKAVTFDMVSKTILLRAVWNARLIHPVWYACFYLWSKDILGEWLFSLWLNSIGNNMHSSFSSCSFISLPSFMFCCRHDYCCLFSQKFEDVDMVHTLYTHTNIFCWGIWKQF